MLLPAKSKGKFQYWMDHEVLHDCIWWNKSQKLMLAQQQPGWNQAVHQIGHECQKAAATKSEWQAPGAHSYTSH